MWNVLAHYGTIASVSSVPNIMIDSSTSIPATAMPATTMPEPSPSRVRLITILGSLVALVPLTIDMYLPALPRIATELAVSSSVAQLTLTGTLIGLALGQLIVGPLSDSLGRRRPLMAGIGVHIVASLMCLGAPDMTTLSIARAIQGMGAAAAMVVAIAVVGDLFSGSQAATVMSRLMLVLGVAPVVAPSLGAVVLLHASWRWVFAVLIVLAGILLIVAALALTESLPVARRRPLQVSAMVRTYIALLSDGRFMVLVLVSALGIAGLFAYIAVAPFVLQDYYGLNQQNFALLFGMGAIFLIGATQFNVVLLRRFSPQRIVPVALIAVAVIGAIFITLSVTHTGGLPGFLLSLWMILIAVGFVISNAPALALSCHSEASGTAAALLGAVQFGLGAIIAPMVGVLGNDATVLAAVMTVTGIIAVVALKCVDISLGSSDGID